MLTCPPLHTYRTYHRKPLAQRKALIASSRRDSQLDAGPAQHDHACFQHRWRADQARVRGSDRFDEGAALWLPNRDGDQGELSMTIRTAGHSRRNR